jgi:hypothetical protein
MKNPRRFFLPFILSFIISICSINATDIKNDGMLKFSAFTPVGYAKYFTIKFSNDAWLDAPVQGNLVIKNSGGQTVFEETMQTSEAVPAYTNGTLTTETPFIAEIPETYTILTHVEPMGMGDIAPTNNDWEGSFESFTAPGFVLFPNEGLEIFQIDFTFEGAPQTNSSYGMVYLDWPTTYELCGFSFGYLNIATADNWIIQNMIYDLSSGYQGLSGMFNLGVNNGEDVLEIDLLAVVSEAPLLDWEFKPVAYFDVSDRPYNAEGVGMPVGNIPAPIPFETLPFVEGGKSDLVWQHGHVTIEQDKNQCAPGAVANSFQWLENKQGVTFPDDHKPGIRDNSLIGKLDTAMGRAAHAGVQPINTLRGKLKYLGSSGVGEKLKIKHKNIKGGTILPNENLTLAGVTSYAHTDTSVSLIDWILAELDSNENVEMRIQWDAGGGHIVDLIGGGYVDGVPWLAWTHDANQGYDNNGTPGTTADDKVAMNGGLSADSGGVGWSYIVENKLRCFIAGASHLGTISYGISESPKPITEVGADKIIPTKFYLAQNYPNPFNPTTTIIFGLPEAGLVDLRIYNILGEEVARLVNGKLEAGYHEVNFDGSNLASGMYFYKLDAGSYSSVKKMLLLK